MLITGPGAIDDLTVATVPAVPLQAHEVRVALRAFSLNFSDLLCVQGLYPNMPPYPFTPGVEGSGIVLEVGADVQRVRPNDAVIVTTSGQMSVHATQVICAENELIQKPRSLSFEQACSLPAVAITAIDAFNKAQLQAGERILIQTAAEGVGLIAVQLAKHHGAEIYATAGSQHKLDYLKQLGVDHVINYRTGDFEEAITRLTAGQGVDVVLNTLSGDALQKGINCLASGGRYIEIAMTALKSARTIDLSVLDDNQTFYSVDLQKLSLKRPEKMLQYRDDMLRLVADDVIRPTLSQVLPFDRIKEAYRCLENRENIGKVVVSVSGGDCLPAKPSPLEPPSLAPETGSTAIAIVGVSGKFPEAEALEDFWSNICAGRDCIRKFSSIAEVRPSLCGSADLEDSGSVQWGGFIEGVDEFDPLFFNISPQEAEWMDPQQRLLLMYTWKAIENAAIEPRALSQGETGVFIAAGISEYNAQLTVGTDDALALTGSVPSMIPSRISYALNLQGPSEYCETACSSALVALHRATHSIERGECEQAIVGAVNLLLSPRGFMGLEAMDYLSSTGQSKSFQADADGFVRSEGVGVVVIRPLSQAQADGNHLYALVKGTGVAHGGKGLSLTAPNAGGMKAAIRQACQAGKVDPATISYIEAHGIASPLADGVEIDALQSGYRELSATSPFKAGVPCHIGSLKPCIGHGEIASGMAALFKVILALRHQVIPGIPRFTGANEHITLENDRFAMTADNRPWPVLKDAQDQALPRRAAINSYGFGGVNAHVIIEEYLDDRDTGSDSMASTEDSPQLIVLSARTEERLKAVAGNLKAYLDNQPVVPAHHLQNIAYTLQVGREAMEYRLAMVVNNRKELLRALQQYVAAEDGADSGVSLYAGSTKETAGQFKTLLSGKVGTVVLDIFLAEKNLDKLAIYWVQGGEIPWPELYKGRPVARVNLPAYPFDRQRYWLANYAGTGLKTSAVKKEAHQGDTLLKERLINATSDQYAALLTDYLTIQVQQLLDLPEPPCVSTSFFELGLHSLIAVELRNKLRALIQMELPIQVTSEYPTIEQLTGFLVDSRPPVFSPDITSPIVGPLELPPWIVRPAEITDLESLCRLEQEEYGWIGDDAVVSVKLMEHRIKTLNQTGTTAWFWVLEREGEVVGWSVLQPTKVDPYSYASWG